MASWVVEWSSTGRIDRTENRELHLTVRRDGVHRATVVVFADGDVIEASTDGDAVLAAVADIAAEDALDLVAVVGQLPGGARC